jgi:hypothetical protein
MFRTIAVASAYFGMPYGHAVQRRGSSQTRNSRELLAASTSLMSLFLCKGDNDSEVRPGLIHGNSFGWSLLDPANTAHLAVLTL